MFARIVIRTQTTLLDYFSRYIDSSNENIKSYTLRFVCVGSTAHIAIQ